MSGWYWKIVGILDYTKDYGLVVRAMMIGTESSRVNASNRVCFILAPGLTFRNIF